MRDKTPFLLFVLITTAFLFGPLTLAAETKPLLPEQLQKQIQDKLQLLGKDYIPRTKHLDATGTPQFTNRLIFESSPYLQQHAHNPVNWYSWGEEAFVQAQAQNKPIFLSIGYSTCHWCHVMEEESFESLHIANILNKHFISIKVDREQLPDIDNTYMMAASMLSGQTGWPLNAFLTSEGNPFYAATYFPPAQFEKLLDQITQLWITQPQELQDSGDAVLEAIQQITAFRKHPETNTTEIAKSAVTGWTKIADEMQGGFGVAPKFPNEPTLLFLLQHSIQHQDLTTLNHLKTTLNAMQQGGIFDQVGGGFHRYTIDPGWLIPHFEKMLYNQAQMIQVYLSAYQITGDPLYRRTAEKTLDYVMAEMHSPSGLFYSASDADSEGEEGKFFLWNLEEIENTLITEEAAFAKEFYGLNEGTNFDGKNILYLPQSIPDFIVEHKIKVQDFYTTVESINRSLLEKRLKRTPPHKDDKSITAWNSMMILALVDAFQVLKDTTYLKISINSADALWEQHYSTTGLLRDSRQKTSGKTASLADYAQFGLANLALYDVTNNPKWLNRSLRLVEDMNQLFWDEESAVFFISKKDTLLPIRAKDRGDGAIPAATSAAYELLHKISQRQQNQSYSIQAERLLSNLSGNLAKSPMQYSYLIKALEENHSGINPLQFGAQGAIKAELSKTGNNYVLSLTMKPGWHINAHSPGNPKLIGSQLSARWVEAVQYPESQPKKVKFSDKPILLYGNESRFIITPSPDKNLLDELMTFTFQACSEKLCLAPETLMFSSAIQ